MRYLLRTTFVLMAAFGLAVGCSSGSSSSKGSGGGTPPPGPGPGPGATLTSITVNPAVTSLNIAQASTITATGHYDDSTSAAISVDWTTSNSGIASISGAATGSSVTIVANAAGSAVITATESTSGFVATTNVTVNPNTNDPSPVYGANKDGEVYVFPSLGGGAPTLLTDLGATTNTGFAMDKNLANPNLYFNYAGEVIKYNIAGNSTEMIVTLDGQALNFDANGFLYTMHYQTGDVTKIDVGLKTASVVGNVGGTKLELDLDSNAKFYAMPIISSAGGAWVYRNNLNGSPQYNWSSAPLGAQHANGFLIPAGFSIHPTTDVAYTGTYLDDKIWSHDDLNSDGDADDANEIKVHAILPVATGNQEHYMSGVAMAPGGSVLVNVNPFSGTDNAVYWLVDNNSDGDAADIGEVVVFNSTNMANNAGTQSICAQH